MIPVLIRPITISWGKAEEVAFVQTTIVVTLLHLGREIEFSDYTVSARTKPTLSSLLFLKVVFPLISSIDVTLAQTFSLFVRERRDSESERGKQLRAEIKRKSCLMLGWSILFTWIWNYQVKYVRSQFLPQTARLSNCNILTCALSSDKHITEECPHILHIKYLQVHVDVH